MAVEKKRKIAFDNTLEHRVRNWVVIQRYRLVNRYRLPRRLVLFFLLGIERTLSSLKILD
jgi:hypothetical protein